MFLAILFSKFYLFILIWCQVAADTSTTIKPTESDLTQAGDFWKYRKKIYEFYGRDSQLVKWPYKTMNVTVKGDIMLGGLMMVHSRSEEKICGSIMAQGGIQALESMLYTIDQVNSRRILDDLTLGAYIKDDCDRDTYGLDQAVDFIKASPKIVSSKAAQCQAAQSGDGADIGIITGVVAAPSSVTSIAVASLLKLFEIPQISFFSTSTELSDKNRFPYFLRTIPSDLFQVNAILELVKLFQWTYVSVVYEDSNYGEAAFKDLDRVFRLNKICIAQTERLPRDGQRATIKDYYQPLENLAKNQAAFNGVGATGVIIIGSDMEVGDFMSAVRDKNFTNKFNWIGSDGWGGRELVHRPSDKDEKSRGGKEKEVDGAVSVLPMAQPIEGFQDYFLNLTPQKNSRNPWFVEFWEDYFECYYVGGKPTPYNGNFSSPCNSSLRMHKSDEKFVMEAQLQFVSDAVMAFAVALKNLKDSACLNLTKSECKMELQKDGMGSQLLKKLQTVTFRGLTNMEFHFTNKSMDGPPRYRILNFQKINGSYQWIDIGRYENRRLQVDWRKLRFRGGKVAVPISSCTPQCKFNERQHLQPGDCICWQCIPCPDYYRVSPDRKACLACPDGTLPTTDRTNCTAIPLEYLNYSSPIALGVLSFATLGIVLTLITIVVFIKFRDTAVVKASGKELSFLLLFGILFLYIMTFFLCAKPTDILCGIQRVGVGLNFSLCYSALLVKTNRIERIFRAGRKSVRRPRFISPLSQIIMCVGSVVVQIIVLAFWLVFDPADIMFHYPERTKNQLVCSYLVGSMYMISVAHPMLLILICTVYAFLTRNIPEGFNESKHIGFSMYSTCVIWLGFVPCYLTTKNFIQIRIATLCVSISLSATVALVCLFAPKLFIIVLHPEKNVRQSMMTSKPSLIQKTTINSTATANNVSYSTLKTRIDSGTQSEDNTEKHNCCHREIDQRPLTKKTNNATQTLGTVTSSDDEQNSVESPLPPNNRHTEPLGNIQYYSTKKLYFLIDCDDSETL